MSQHIFDIEMLLVIIFFIQSEEVGRMDKCLEFLFVSWIVNILGIQHYQWQVVIHFLFEQLVLSYETGDGELEQVLPFDTDMITL